MTGRGAEGQRACHGWLPANRLILVTSALSPGRRDAVVSAPGEAYCRGKDAFGMPLALNTAAPRTRLSTRPGGTLISWNAPEPPTTGLPGSPSTGSVSATVSHPNSPAHERSPKQ